MAGHFDELSRLALEEGLLEGQIVGFLVVSNKLGFLDVCGRGSVRRRFAWFVYMDG